MTTLSEEEKEHVMAAFGSLPTSTIDEALDNFHKAEELNPGHIDNLIYLGKCYTAKGNYSEAQKYLMLVLEITPIDEMDEAQMAEAQELLVDIKNRKGKSNGKTDEVDTDLEKTENSIESASSYSEKSNVTS
ncbi:hypothetical protein LOAG_10212 [Loa loa]|nr:hypothetical protein LOAG_10212 [Loa loa]EFO18283.1 hypothetical protein LOAG_10212 [Loa loa]